MSKVSQWPGRIVTLFYLLVTLSLPFLYNNCSQSGPPSGADDNPQIEDLNCQDFQNNITRKLEVRNAEPVSIMLGQSSKLFLNEASDDGKTFQKFSSSPFSKFTVIANTKCVKNSPKSFSAELIGDQISEWPGKMFAFKHEVANAIELKQFESKINADKCILVANPEQQYKSQALTFNDSISNSQQGHLNTLQAFDAYEMFFNATFGIPQVSSDGDPTLVAVVDSGIIHNHVDLKTNVGVWNSGDERYKGFNAKTTSFEGKCGTSSCINSVQADSNGHGTHVAGLIGALANNGGVHGISPFNTKLMNIRALYWSSDAEASITDSTTLSNAIIFASANAVNGIKVMNISISKIGYHGEEDMTLKQALTDAVDNGIFVSLAIGNSDLEDGTISQSDLVDEIRTSIPGKYGAEVDGVMTVAATTGSPGQLASFSLYHPQLAEIAAPGQNIKSTVYDIINKESLYVDKSGTSQASPQVAAAATLMINILKKHDISASPQTIEQFIKLSSSKQNSLVDYVEEGNELNLLKLTEAIAKAYPKTVGEVCN